MATYIVGLQGVARIFAAGLLKVHKACGREFNRPVNNSINIDFVG